MTKLCRLNVLAFELGKIHMEYLLPVALGVSLAAATGFRVFLPLLITGLAAKAGYLPMTESMNWIATTPALLMLAVAATTEIIAYYVPLLDNLLDGLAGPTAVVAGIAVSYAVMGDLPPMLKWTLAIIAGGGAAAATQSVTTLLRGTSTVVTMGLGNSAVTTAEIIGAVLLSLLAILLPYLALAAVVIFVIVAWRFVMRMKNSRTT